MIINEYEPLVRDLLYDFNPIKKTQVIRALCKYYADVDKETAEGVLQRMQRNRELLISQDGWILTKGKYIQLTGDDGFSKIDFQSEDMCPEIDELVEKYCDMKPINCLWIMIDMLPASMEYALHHKPWHISFVSAKRKLYEVIYIPFDEEIVKFELLASEPTGFYPELKENIERVVVLEKQNHASSVPKGVGIRYICVLDESTPSGYRVIEKRENTWDEL